MSYLFECEGGNWAVLIEARAEELVEEDRVPHSAQINRLGTKSNYRAVK